MCSVSVLQSVPEDYLGNRGRAQQELAEQCWLAVTGSSGLTESVRVIQPVKGSVTPCCRLLYKGVVQPVVGHEAREERDLKTDSGTTVLCRSYSRKSSFQ